MMKTSISFLVPLLAAAYVHAHGFVHEITIDGKSYIGNVPNGPKKPSIIRQISEVDPVKGAKNAAVNCGPNASPASLTADANPGSKLTFDWRGGDLSKWPHNTGPMLTYMASCGDTTCDKFDSQNAKWFKIQEIARDSNGDWNQDNTLFAAQTADVTLPSNIAPGNYLIRHEIIALHLAEQQGGAEFYPSCAQIKIGGSGTGKPTASELVSLPGAYSDNDPGILDKNAFNARVNYVFPGPKIAAFVNGGASGGDDSGNDDSGNDDGSDAPTSTKGSGKPTSTGSPKPTTTKKSSSGSGSCKLKKGSKSTASVKVAARSAPTAVHPHRFSRIMRDLITTGRHHHHEQLS